MANQYYDGFTIEGADRVRSERWKVKASTAIVRGDALKRTATADTLEPAVAGDTVVAIYHDTDRAASETDTPYRMVIPVTEDTRFYAPVEAGTFTAANVNTTVDLNSADGINMTTTSGGDFFIEKYISAAIAVGRFVRRAAE